MSSHDELSGDHMEHMAAIDLVDPATATHVAVASGDWFDPATWANGEVPGADDRAFIPEGIDVKFSGESDASLFSLGIAGSLQFDPEADSKLVLDTMIVLPSGYLEIGTEDAPIAGNVDIVIANNGAIDTEWDPQLLSRGVVSLGEVSIHGSAVDSHIKVTEDPMAGDSSITLANVPFGWSIGDTIVIAGTENGGHTDTRYDDEHRGHTSETREIVEIQGNTIIFDTPLDYDHASPRDYFKTSVANYSRSVTISSEDGAESEIYERGHVMFMGSDDVDVRFAAFDELGRTDKSERSTPVGELETVSFDSNVQGRYSLHLHKLGVEDQDNPITIEGNAVIGSPGWGIAQHSSNANLHNNATLDIWGASYISEAGDETGTWTDNISIGNVGTETIERLHSDVAASDVGRTGNGFWMQSRMIETIDNIAVAARTGFVWISQGSAEEHDPAHIDQPESVGFGETVRNLELPVATALNNEVFGSEMGFTVTKGWPNQGHDVRSVMDGFDAWNVRAGAKAQYTSHYTFKNMEFVAVDGSDPDAQPEWGFLFANNVSDMVIDQPIIDGFDYAYSFTDFFTDSVNAAPGDKQFFVVGGALSNLGSGVFEQEDWAERTTLIDPEDITYVTPTVDVLPVMTVSDDYRVYFDGTRTDSLGDGPLVLGTDVYALKNNDLRHIIQTDGYFTKGDTYGVIAEAYYMDRLTGEMIKEGHFVDLGSTSINSSYWAGKIYRGELPDNNPAPVANDDTASTLAREPVTLNLLNNDSDETTLELRVDGFVQPQHGRVVLNEDGSVTYTPDMGFTGEDSFEYWVTDGYGAFTKATVTVAVDEKDAEGGGATTETADAIIEIETLTVEQPNGATWHSVEFDAPIEDAVVLMGPVSMDGIQPAMPRVRNVTETGFEFQIDEWQYQDGYHLPATVTWMAASAGDYEMADGRRVSFGETTAENEDVSSVVLDEFDNAPVVIAQVGGAGPQAVTTRLAAVTEDGFNVRMQEQERSDGHHIEETIYWMAIEEGDGDLAAFNFDGVDHQFRDTGIDTPDHLVADIQTYRGWDPAILRYAETSSGSLALRVQEERSYDDEVLHWAEVVGTVHTDQASVDLFSL